MPNQVPDSVKSERIQKLVDVQNAITEEINGNLKGDVVEVLVEGTSKTNPSMLSGRTRTNKLVVFRHTRQRIKGGIWSKSRFARPVRGLNSERWFLLTLL